MPADLDDRYSLFLADLAAQLDRRLLSALSADVAATITISPGKHRRATLVFLAGHLGSPDRQQLCAAATVVEILQTASLIHDDVIDRAARRRGVAAVHRQVGEPMALLVGAGMFATASEVAADLGLPAAQDLARSAVRLSRGELLDIERAFDLEITPEDHLALLDSKTGALFSLPAVLGGRCAGLSADELAALDSLGRAAGVAYQLADDWADLCGTDPGKPQGTDCRNGLYGLAVLHTLTDADDRLLREHLAAPDPALIDPDFVLERVRLAGGDERVHAAISSSLAVARTSLSLLPDCAARSGLGRFVRSLALEVAR